MVPSTLHLLRTLYKNKTFFVLSLEPNAYIETKEDRQYKIEGGRQKEGK